MRWLLIALTLQSLVLVVLAGACAASSDDSMGGADSDSDSDSDSDTDIDTDVPIEYPEAINHFLNPNGLMTGPISPPPEDVFGEDLEPTDEPDAGSPDEELDDAEEE